MVACACQLPNPSDCSLRHAASFPSSFSYSFHWSLNHLLFSHLIGLQRSYKILASMSSSRAKADMNPSSHLKSTQQELKKSVVDGADRGAR